MKSHATRHLQLDGLTRQGSQVPLRQALAEVRRAMRPNPRIDAAHVYECTDRDGNHLHIAYVHWTPGYWTNTTDVTEIYEIPDRELVTYARASVSPFRTAA